MEKVNNILTGEYTVVTEIWVTYERHGCMSSRRCTWAHKSREKVRDGMVNLGFKKVIGKNKRQISDTQLCGVREKLEEQLMNTRQ